MASQAQFLLLWSLLIIASAYPLHAAEYSPLSSKKTLNVIDSCWRRKLDWTTNRNALADCAIGFGKDAIGGKYGETYVVTDPSDHATHPKPGTLRYAVVQKEPLWIIFDKDMVITLKSELIINSYKTIDGRGVKVEIAHGPCITIQDVSHVIIHGISIHDCKRGKPGLVLKDKPGHISFRGGVDGDGIVVLASSHIWIDHCYFARCNDGLIDVIHGSTAVTISNNYFTEHDKVMLLGHNDKNKDDVKMKVTLAFNHFGSGLVQRMPRVRIGYAHVANNRYDKWLMYAIGGSANPTIFSEGNYFLASDHKQVTKRQIKNGWKNWNWRSSKDKFLNGAYFVESGSGSYEPDYKKSESFLVADGSLVPNLTVDAGPFWCTDNKNCF